MAVFPAERPYTFALPSPAEDFSEIQGVGVIIVNPTGTHMLVVDEMVGKDASSRGIGQCSPPLETAKKGPLGIGRERLPRTILGALAEVVDDTGLSTIKPNLRQVRLGQRQQVALSDTVTAHVEVFVYHGNLESTPFASTSSHETTTPRWVSIQDFLQDPNARPWGQKIVLFAKEQGHLHPTTLHTTYRRSVLDRLDSMGTFYQKRERRPDVALT